MKKFTGTGTALVTPFLKDGSIDESSLRNLIRWQIKSGVEFLVPCGSTGESATMNREERNRVIEITVDEAKGKIPVVAGTGTNSTQHSIELTKDAKAIGADAVLLVGPYYNKPTQEGFYRHFVEIVERAKIKAIIYNVPGRTACNFTAETTLRLAQHELIIGIKEASNILEQVMQIIKYRPKNFSVLSGEDSLTLPLITAGGDGVISVISNEVPRDFSEMVRFALKGNLKKAQELHYKLFELMRANFIESNPIPVKTALCMMKKIEDNFRLPLVKMGKDNKEKLRRVLRDLKLL